MLLGGAIGLAAAAKYIAAIVLPFAIVVVLLSSSEVPDWRARFRLADIVVSVAVALFALIHLPALWDPVQFE